MGISLSSNIKLNDCILKENSSKKVGAGLYLYGSKEVYLEYVKIVQNKAIVNGGGIYSHEKSDNLHINNCLFTYNEAKE